MKPTAAFLGIELPVTRYRSVRARFFLCGALSLAVAFSMPRISFADEGGVSYWLPGFYGSLAAVQQQPEWSVLSISSSTTVSAGGDVFLSRQFPIPTLPVNPSATATASLHATGDIGTFAPT